VPFVAEGDTLQNSFCVKWEQENKEGWKNINKKTQEKRENK